MAHINFFLDTAVLTLGGVAILSGVNALRQSPRREFWLRTSLAATSTTAVVLLARKSLAGDAAVAAGGEEPLALRRIGPGVRRVWGT